MKKKLWTLAAVATIFAACNNDEMEVMDNVLPSDNVIRVEAGVGAPATRSLTSANLTEFGLFVTNQNTDETLAGKYTYANVQMQKADDVWNPTDNTILMLWQNASTSVNVVAYAPYNTSADLTNALTVSVKTTQNTEADFIASDFVYGRADVIPSGTQTTTNDIYYDETTQRLKVKMNHKLAKLNVTIATQGNLDGATVNNVTLKNVATSGTVTLSDGTVTAGDIDANTSIAMYAGTSQYEAIFVPGEATFEISVDVTASEATEAETKTYKHSKFTFEGGKEYNLALVVGKEILLVNDVEIGEWTAHDADENTEGTQNWTGEAE